MKIRDRIKGFRRIPASKLRPNPRNWRTHPDAQRNAFRGLLAEIGIADANLARELPDGTFELIDGHMRTEELGDQKIPTLVLDLTDEEAAKLLASLDPLASMAEADQEQLSSLLREIDTDSEALDAMLNKLAVDCKLQDLDAQPEEPAPDAPSDAAEDPVGGESEDPRIQTERSVTCPNCGHEITL